MRGRARWRARKISRSDGHARSDAILRYTLAVLSVAALLDPRPSAAIQTVGTATGSVVGTVVGSGGTALAGVGITIAGDRLMQPRSTSTGDDGSFRFTALPPGDFVVSFAHPGFATHRHPVSVAIGGTTSVDVTLALAPHQERLTVTAHSRVLDLQSAAIAYAFDAGRLADLPGSRSTSMLFATTPAVVTTTTEVGGSVAGIGGATGAYGTRGSNRPTIEGIVLSGIGSAGLTLDYGSFEHAAVLTGSHGPEWATPGVHVQVVTKSGGNRYHGTLYADYEDRHWQSFNVDRQQISRGAQSGGGLSAADANRLWHYRDVNADIGGFIVRNRLWWYASFRDQEISTRLVNFQARPHRTRLTNYSGKATLTLAPGHTFVGYAQSARNHQPNGLDPFGPAGSGLGAATAINTGESSTADQRTSGLIWKGEWQAALDDKLLVEVRFGQFDNEQRWLPRSPSPRFEDTQTLLVTGGNRDSHSRLRRDQLYGNVSYFTNGGVGSHHLKLGVEMTRWLTLDALYEGYPGNVLHVMRNGSPSEVYLFETPSDSQTGLWTYAAHVSDSWRVHDRIGLNAGVRFDGYRVFLPAQEHPAGSTDAQQFSAVPNLIDWHVVVPRLSGVFSLTGDAKTLAKVGVAQYRVAPGAGVGVNSNPNPMFWWMRFEWTDLDGSGFWERGEEGRRFARRGGAASESLDPALQLPLVNEVTGWLERELPAGIGVRTGVIWRSEHHHFSRQNAHQPFDAFTVPVSLRDPGPDGIEGTADDGRSLTAYDLAAPFLGQPPVNVVRNVPGSRSEYWTWEAAAERRRRGTWTFGAGFSHTWSADHAATYSQQAVRNNAYPLTPNDLINTGPGGRHEFRTWTAKAHGSYDAPWRIRISPVLRHQSGQPFGRTFAAPLRYGTVVVLAEPVGARRLDHRTTVDVRVEKTFAAGWGGQTVAFVDVFNAFNANPEQNVVWSSGGSFLRPIDIVAPRIARLGVKLTW